MRILGVDPGIDVTGYGVIDDDKNRFRLLEAGIIKTSPKDALQKRLKKIYNGINEIIDKYKPKALVLEELYSHYRHPTTVIMMGHGRGVICLAGGEKDIPVIDYSAKRIKKAVTGNGNASKEQVQRMVQNVLGIAQTAIPLDVTDALAAAITHSYVKDIRV
ncbi:MAG: crossover junction endodeoxyribonuclease RuvC [Candidatus Omnitrophica bacterium]|nr:crossover junction endodeoxyribonuclease RuvC [Candidatus Omnitrophota bacterium]